MSSIDNTPHAIYSNSSVTDLIDVKDAGSGNIITDDERNTILTNKADTVPLKNLYKIKGLILLKTFQYG